MPFAKAREISIVYENDEPEPVGVFTKQPDGTWTQQIGGFRVSGYDEPNVLRVVSNALGTKEIAD